jgi:hypothetical protein
MTKKDEDLNITSGPKNLNKKKIIVIGHGIM